MILWTDHGEDRNKWTDVGQDRKKSCQMSECSRHSDGHKCGARLPYVLFIPDSCFRTVKSEGFKLFTFSASKEIIHSPSNAHSRINAVLKRKSLLWMLHCALILNQKFKYWGTLYYSNKIVLAPFPYTIMLITCHLRTPCLWKVINSTHRSCQFRTYFHKHCS